MVRISIFPSLLFFSPSPTVELVGELWEGVLDRGKEIWDVWSLWTDPRGTRYAGVFLDGIWSRVEGRMPRGWISTNDSSSFDRRYPRHNYLAFEPNSRNLWMNSAEHLLAYRTRDWKLKMEHRQPRLRRSLTSSSLHRSTFPRPATPTARARAARSTPSTK